MDTASSDLATSRHRSSPPEETRLDVCEDCDQSRYQGIYLTCDLVGFDRNGRVLPCAKMLADMQSEPRAQCPHPDAAQRQRFANAALNCPKRVELPPQTIESMSPRTRAFFEEKPGRAAVVRPAVGLRMKL